MELFFTFGQKNGAVLRLENGPLQMRSVGVFNGAEDPLLGRLARPQAAQRTGQTGLDTGTGLDALGDHLIEIVHQVEIAAVMTGAG